MPIDDQRWAIVEILGHRRVCCQVSEETIAGASMLRLDIPNNNGKPYTQYLPPTSIFSLTLVTADAAQIALAGTEFHQDPPWEWDLKQIAEKVSRTIEERRAAEDELPF